VGSRLDRWTRQLVRRGVRAGLIEGSNIWLSIGAIAWLFRFLSRRSPAQVSVEQLRLGESIIVSHVPAAPRGKRAKRNAAREAAKLEERTAREQAKREASRRNIRATAKAARALAEEAAEALAAEAAREARQARKAARGAKPSRRHDGEGRESDRSEGTTEAPA
jgi:hypothetical protein